MEKILLFNLSDDMKTKIDKYADSMRIKTVMVFSRFYQDNIGDIAAESQNLKGSYEGEIPHESLIIMCGLTEKHMDRLLFQLRQDKADISYKAVLTEFNRKWTPLRMFYEMEAEKRSYEKGN